MSIPSFDPSQVNDFGTKGKRTVQGMQEAVERYNSEHQSIGRWQRIFIALGFEKTQELHIAYDTKSKQFTLLGSSHLSKREVEVLFSGVDQAAWKPCVLEQTDSSGNKIVVLKPAGTKQLFEEEKFSGDYRDQEAARLIEALKSHVGFLGSRILDVGCRSGENALAMQARGAEVIGIDPNSQEFSTGIQKGLQKEQLVQATLQEYTRRYPKKKFHLVTVFLWNIFREEWDSFLGCLVKVVIPGGTVILGFNQSDLVEELEQKIRNTFARVKKIELPGRRLNNILLICKAPRRGSS